MKESLPHRLSRLADELESGDSFVDDVMSRVDRTSMRTVPRMLQPAAMMLASAAVLVIGMGIGFVAAGWTRPVESELAHATTGHPLPAHPIVAEARNGHLLSLEYAPSSEQVAGVVVATSSPWSGESEMVVILSSSRSSQALSTFGIPLLATSLTRQELLDALEQRSGDQAWTVEPAVSIRTTAPAEPLKDLVRQLTTRAAAFDSPLTHLTFWGPRFD